MRRRGGFRIVVLLPFKLQTATDLQTETTRSTNIAARSDTVGNLSVVFVVLVAAAHGDSLNRNKTDVLYCIAV